MLLRLLKLVWIASAESAISLSIHWFLLALRFVESFPRLTWAYWAASLLLYFYLYEGKSILNVFVPMNHICFQQIYVQRVPWRWPGTWSMYFGSAVCVNESPAFQATQVDGHCNGAAYLKVETTLKRKSCDFWSCSEPVWMRPAYFRFLKCVATAMRSVPGGIAWWGLPSLDEFVLY